LFLPRDCCRMGDQIVEATGFDWTPTVSPVAY
jgi:hypothetical protein